MMIDSNWSSWFYHVIYMIISQIWYVLYRGSTGSCCPAELVNRMLQVTGSWYMMWLLSCLQVPFCQMESAWWGTCYQAWLMMHWKLYLYFKVLKGNLEYFSFWTKERIDILSKCLKYIRRYLSYVKVWWLWIQETLDWFRLSSHLDQTSSSQQNLWLRHFLSQWFLLWFSCFLLRSSTFPSSNPSLFSSSLPSFSSLSRVIVNIVSVFVFLISASAVTGRFESRKQKMLSFDRTVSL